MVLLPAEKAPRRPVSFSGRGLSREVGRNILFFSSILQDSTASAEIFCYHLGEWGENNVSRRNFEEEKVNERFVRKDDNGIAAE